MNAATRACAPSGVAWHGINWATVHRQVRRLQARIVQAIQEGRPNKVKALQWLLTHSFSGSISGETSDYKSRRHVVVEPGAERCLCRGLSRVMGNYHARF